jgi:hypothetical protein
MQAREIPRERWGAFFDSFSRQHDGWLVTVEAAGFDLGGRAGAREMPLAGFARGAKCDGGNVISIFLGKAPGEHLTHTVAAPKYVRLKETEAGAHEWVEIESATGEVTRVRFRSAVRPEMVDGVVAE